MSPSRPALQTDGPPHQRRSPRTKRGRAYSCGRAEAGGTRRSSTTHDTGRRGIDASDYAGLTKAASRMRGSRGSRARTSVEVREWSHRRVETHQRSTATRQPIRPRPGAQRPRQGPGDASRTRYAAHDSRTRSGAEASLFTRRPPASEPSPEPPRSEARAPPRLFFALGSLSPSNDSARRIRTRCRNRRTSCDDLSRAAARPAAKSACFRRLACGSDCDRSVAPRVQAECRIPARRRRGGAKSRVCMCGSLPSRTSDARLRRNDLAAGNSLRVIVENVRVLDLALESTRRESGRVRLADPTFAEGAPGLRPASASTTSTTKMEVSSGFSRQRRAGTPDY
jgi:hypothetical protein